MKKLADDVECEVNKLSPKKGDLVIIKLRSPDLDDAILKRVREQLAKRLPAGVDTLIWGFATEEDEASSFCISANDLRAAGHCPKCGRKGEWRSLALVCPTHGVFG